MRKNPYIIALLTILLGWYAPSLALEGGGEGGGVIASEAKQSPLDFQPTTYPLGGFPRATSLSDIDSDGDLDIIVTNPNKQEIVILLNKMDGTFEISNSYPIDGYPISIVSLDIDGDSDIDLVVLDSNGSVRILKGQSEVRSKVGGRGRLFSPGGIYPVELYSFSINPSDADRDGDMDFIVLSGRKTQVLLNDGKGGFDTILTYPAGVNPNPRITADLNSDLKDDMIIGDKNGISVLLNNGDNTFAKGIGYATGEMPLSVVAGDLDSDLDNDLVVANYKSHTISILRNNGDGTFQEAVNYPSPKGPNSITLGDIDGDEDLDIIVTNGLSGELSIFINNIVRPVTIITDSLPQGSRGKYYETRLEAKGGIPPYSWAVIEGSLPPSLYLDPLTGEIISTPLPHPFPLEGEAHHGQIPNPNLRPELRSRESEIPNEGEPFITLEPLCICLKAPTGLYRFTVQATDSSSATANADLYIEVLPQPGAISGKIKYSGEKGGAIRIGLWATSQTPLMKLFITPIFETTITAPGEYKIKNIYPESYFVSAYLDVNGDGRKQEDEPYGAFGSGEKPEAVVVDDGAALTGIDIELVDSK